MSSEPTGVKHDVGKNRLDLIPPEAIEALGWVLSHGSKKYGDNNWRGGIKYSRVYGATLRHLVAWARGEYLDKESELPHLWHALCELAFLVTYEAYPDMDLNDMASASKPITDEDIYGSDFDPDQSFAPRSVKDLIQGPPEALPSIIKKRIYVSHPIRGKSGTPEEILTNVQIAREWGKKLRTTYPDINWYIPADHDEVVQELLRLGEVNIYGVMRADYAIIDRCDGLVAIPWCESAGVKDELLFADEQWIPIFRAKEDFDVQDLAEYIGSL